MIPPSDIRLDIARYRAALAKALATEAIDAVPVLAVALREAWRDGRHVFICGNGGSAANALHLANDLFYGAGATSGGGLKAEALSANVAILTCLANDTGYDNVYAEQLKAKADAGDLLIVLSGSGNSPNVVRALEVAAQLGMATFAVLGYAGGRCKALAQHPIHFAVDDMQIAEDLQLIVGHICMQWLCANPIRSGAAEAAE